MSRISIHWVIKFGGSLSRSDALPAWLHALADLPCLIVPGGGPFADAVRAAQTQQGFGDPLAHDLAIRAMGLYGRMLGGMEPRLTLVESVNELRQRRDLGQPLVWLPHPDEPCLESLKASWDVSSDSIAAQLALHLEIPHLLLVKSLESPPGQEDLAHSAQAGIVDPAFTKTIKGKALQLWRTGPSGSERLAKGLQDPVSWLTQMTL